MVYACWEEGILVVFPFCNKDMFMPPVDEKMETT